MNKEEKEDKKIEEPKDLGIKIAEDPTQAKWMEIKEKALTAVQNCLMEAEINQAVAKYAQSKIDAKDIKTSKPSEYHG